MRYSLPLFFFARANVYGKASNATSSSTTATNVTEPSLTVQEDTPRSSDAFLPGPYCGLELEMCAEAASCFDHTQDCAEDGSFTAIECSFVSAACGSCFPNSRCGISGDEPLEADKEETINSSTFVEGPECGPVFSLCAEASPCFDHNVGCRAQDATVIFQECQPALPFCEPCFPYSRCGSGGDDIEDNKEEEIVHESASFEYNDNCGPELIGCRSGQPCFDHTVGCREDGTVDMTIDGLENCQLALDFCMPCFPKSRCAGGVTDGSTTTSSSNNNTETIDLGMEFLKSQTGGDPWLENSASGSYDAKSTRNTLLLWIHSVGIGVLLLNFMTI